MPSTGDIIISQRHLVLALCGFDERLSLTYIKCLLGHVMERFSSVEVDGGGMLGNQQFLRSDI